MRRFKEILTEMYKAASFDVSRFLDRVCDVEPYREPEEAVQSRPCFRPPAPSQLRATKTSYLSVVVDKAN